jgi:hypothetical protein
VWTGTVKDDKLEFERKTKNGTWDCVAGAGTSDKGTTKDEGKDDVILLSRTMRASCRIAPK